MSQNNSNNKDEPSSINLVNMCEGKVLENLAKFVDDTLIDMKKCLDKVLDLRVQTAELEVNLTMLYNPYLLNSLEEMKDIGTHMTHVLQEDSVDSPK